MKDTLFNKEDFESIFGTPKVHMNIDPMVRNAVLEEVALEFDAMRIAFGDTSDSFARYVREMKT